MWQRLSTGPWHNLNITVNFHGFTGSGFTENLNSPTSKVNERKVTLNGEL